MYIYIAYIRILGDIYNISIILMGIVQIIGLLFVSVNGNSICNGNINMTGMGREWTIPSPCMVMVMEIEMGTGLIPFGASQVINWLFSKSPFAII